MATHSSVLAWRIPGSGEPCRLPSMRSHRVGHDWHDLAAAAEQPYQFTSVTQLCLTLWYPMDCSTPSLPVHHQLLECAQMHVHQVGHAIQPSHPLFSPSPPAFNFSQHQGIFQWFRLFSSHQDSQTIGASALASVLSMNIQDSFPLGLTGLIALQSKGPWTLQQHSSKAPILWCLAFFIVHISHEYMTTGKTIALTRQTFLSNVMSLILNMLSRLVITFIPRISVF